MKKSTLVLALIAVMAISNQAFALGDPLTLTYAGGTGQGRSTSSFVENQWEYRYQYHMLALSGDIPQGKLFSQIQLEERDYITGLGYAKLGLYGSTYAIDLGDNTANFSDITLNNLSYQGASITLKPSSNFNLTVLGGSRGNGLWGYDVRRDTRAKQNFTGVKSAYSPGGGLGLTATYLSTPGGADVAAYGTEYVFDKFKLGAEYGSATEGKAFRGEIKYQDNLLSLGTIYRDVDTTYIVPFDYASYKGMKGTYSSLGIRPSNNLTLNMQSNSYADRINGADGSTNNDMRGDLTYNLETGTSIGYSGFKNDRSGYERGGITEGEMMYITQQFYLLTRNAVYYRVQPIWFESLNPSEESYSEEKNVAGLNISLFDYIHLNYEIENSARIFKSTEFTLKPSAITMRMDIFEAQIYQSPFWLASSINYRKDTVQKDSTEEAEETTNMYSDLTLKYIPSPDLSCYITGKVNNITAPDAERTTKEQVDLTFGLNYTFNTFIYLK